tara:strand:- start:1341 stop:1475 length:135 start_codon:yes stop_codon:yes gene_type:complete
MTYHMRDMKRSRPARPVEIVEALFALSFTLLATALLLALAVCFT